MSLSLGGGSFINALMGQAGNVGQQRQRQQDQLMQMMMQGFVPNEASQQEAQGKGLLSQLIGPTGALPLQSPKPMRPTDFEMAPWNPAEVSRLEREERGRLQTEKLEHNKTLQEGMNEAETERARVRSEHEIAMAKIRRDHEYDLQSAGDDKAKARIGLQNELRVALEEMQQANKLAEIAAKAEAAGVSGPKQWNEVLTTIQTVDTMMQSLIDKKGWSGFSPENKRAYEAYQKARLALIEKLPAGVSAMAELSNILNAPDEGKDPLDEKVDYPAANDAISSQYSDKAIGVPGLF